METGKHQKTPLQAAQSALLRCAVAHTALARALLCGGISPPLPVSASAALALTPLPTAMAFSALLPAPLFHPAAGCLRERYALAAPCLEEAVLIVDAAATCLADGEVCLTPAPECLGYAFGGFAAAVVRRAAGAKAPAAAPQRILQSATSLGPCIHMSCAAFAAFVVSFAVEAFRLALTAVASAPAPALQAAALVRASVAAVLPAPAPVAPALARHSAGPVFETAHRSFYVQVAAQELCNVQCATPIVATGLVVLAAASSRLVLEQRCCRYYGMGQGVCALLFGDAVLAF